MLSLEKKSEEKSLVDQNFQNNLTPLLIFTRFSTIFFVKSVTAIDTQDEEKCLRNFQFELERRSCNNQNCLLRGQASSTQDTSSRNELESCHCGRVANHTPVDIKTDRSLS